MARVTVEDCLKRVANRFALTVLAARRARELGESRGTPLVDCDNKVGVTALREIGAGGVRYTENVEDSVRQFIAEQRQQLEQYGLSDRGFAMDAVSFSGSADGDDDEAEDIDSDIEELPSDLSNVRPSRSDTAADSDDSTPANAIDEISDTDDDTATSDTVEDDDDSPDDEVPGEILEAAGLDDDEDTETDLGDLVDGDDDDDDDDVSDKPEDDDDGKV